MAEATPASGQALGQALELGESPNRRAWLRFRDNRPAMLASVFLIALILLAVCWPWISDLGDRHSDAQFAAPSAQFWFGTDVHGRDLFGRVMAGTRISLLVGLVGALVSLVIGVAYGATAGYAGGRVDGVMMRIVDILYAMPFLFFVILLMVFFGRNILLIFVAIGAINWLDMARIVRGQTLALKQQPFIEAARMSGASPFAIVLRHIVPNLLGVVAVYITLTIPQVILFESFLSFLGLGVQEPATSWGALIKDGADEMGRAPWLLVVPAVLLAATLFCFNFIGDGLRDALDPKDR